jgi:membrane protease subunit (stomatin/prohibitin family)
MTRRMWCHSCNRWVTAEVEDEGEDNPTPDATWTCRNCGDTIVCDNCGALMIGNPPECVRNCAPVQS